MKVMVVSDCHDNIWNLERAFGLASKPDALISCGDMCSPFTLARLGEGIAGPVHAVFGNNDGDVYLMLQNILPGHRNITLYPTPMAEIELDGRRIAIVHYPHIAEPLAMSGKFDLVCYGHSHKREMARVGKTLRLNPGEISGVFGRPSFAIYDTAAGEAAYVDLPS